MSKPVLKLDWCSHEAAKHAVENWHYSGRLPMPPMVRVGVWEDGEFVGCVVFSRGASPGLGNPYGLSQTEVVELTRIAMKKHTHTVSRIVSIACKMLVNHCPGVRLVVSFADPSQGHVGGVYQAGNWVYTGASKPELQFFIGGRWLHRREAVGRVAFGSSVKQKDWKSAPSRQTPGKHRYLMPLDDEMRKRIAPLALPYPKRVRSADSGTPGVQPGGGGAMPTRTLSNV